MDTFHERKCKKDACRYSSWTGTRSGVLAYEPLAAERPLYFIDLPRFARSSRPDFSTIPLETEEQYVNCLEAWRKEMKLERFILMGFSMGGFISTSFAFRFPNRISHLILVESWLFPSKPSGLRSFFEGRTSLPLPPILSALAHNLTLRMNHLFTLRVGGVFRIGIKSASIVMGPLLSRFSLLGENGTIKITTYIYHANAQKPSGEAALFTMQSSAGVCWATFPMNERIPKFLSEKIPLTLVYGKQTWLPYIPVDEMKKMRPNSYVEGYLIDGANHECNVWQSDIFNKIAVKACFQFDQNEEKT